MRKKEGAPIKRLAAHQVKGCERDVSGKHQYVVVADYNAKYDSGKSKSREPTKRFPVDILICAGGKNSAVRNNFFNHAPVTNEKVYGVATWD